MAVSPLLSPELLRELDAVRFAPRSRVEGRHAGRHKSPAQGSSTEFRDYRAYAPGDDPARVDWRVFARNDRTVIRTYEQESQTGCVILLDRSASMGFGAPASKFQHARRISAALAYLVHRSQDQVGLYCFNDREREWHAPGGTPRHLDLLLHRLENTEAAGETLLPEALRRADALVRRRCTLAVVSDFYCDPAACFEALNPFVHRGCDLHLLHLQDPVERDLPDAAFLNFQDLENGQRLRADPKSLRENYRKALEAHHGAFRALAMRRGIQYRVVGTDEPVVSSLAGLVG